MAWLHSSPKLNDKDDSPKSRGETLNDNDPQKKLPHADQYLTECFRIAGTCMSGGMGASSLTWSEIESFTNKSGYRLNGWESEQIIMMSRSYCNFLHKAKDKNCRAPFYVLADDEEEIDIVRKKADDQFESIFNSLSQQKRP